MYINIIHISIYIHTSYSLYMIVHALFLPTDPLMNSSTPKLAVQEANASKQRGWGIQLISLFRN